MTTPISSFALECQRANIPLLFLDTCSLLDILRFHIRMESDQQAIRNLSAINQLLNATPSKVRLVSAMQVNRELASNKESIFTDALKESERINQRALVQASVLQFLEPTASIPLLPEPTKIKDLSLQLMERCIDKMTFLEDDTSCESKAMARAVNDVPPSKQGGTVKDCIVLEHCLELANQLRAGGFVPKIVFLSSNTRDYCSSGASFTLKDPIGGEFGALQIVFVNSWEWAQSELGI